MMSVNNDDDGFIFLEVLNPPELQPDQHQKIIAKAQEIFAKESNETVEYSRDRLKYCGEIKVSTGELKPFTNFGLENPHTYQSNIAYGEGKPIYHVRLALAIIKKYLPRDEASFDDPFVTLQKALNEDEHPQHAQALRIAALLYLIGDELSLLPLGTPVFEALAPLGGQVFYGAAQRGKITFSDALKISISGEELGIRKIGGHLIAMVAVEREITIGDPDADGTVICTIARKYLY